MKPAGFARVLTLTLAAWVAPIAAQQAPSRVPPRSFDFLGAKVTVLLSGADTGGTSTMMKMQIPAQKGPPPHIHTREDEVFKVTSGAFQFFMDGMCLEAGPGAAVYMPKGHIHTLKNVSDHASELLVVAYPAGLEQFFLDVHEMGLKMPQDFAKLNELSNRKYGINHLPGHDFKAGKCKKVGVT